MSDARSEGLRNRDSVWDLMGSADEPSANSYIIRMAWPTYAWRALAPKQVGSDTDPLTLAILRLARAGVTGVHEIGRLLDLREKTILQAVWRSTSLGLLATDGKITAPGLAMVDRNEPPDAIEHEVETGWVFRDALAGDVLPMFHVGSLQLRRRLSKSPDTILPCDDLFAEQPSTSDIVAALKWHRRNERRSSPGQRQDAPGVDVEHPAQLSGRAWQEVDDESNGQDSTGLTPRLVKLLVSEPERVDIVVCFYVSANDPSVWHIWSPFADRSGVWFEQRLAWVLSKHELLRLAVEGWMADACELFPPLENEAETILGTLPFLRHCGALDAVTRDLMKAFRAERSLADDPDAVSQAFLGYSRALEGTLLACIETVPRTEREAFVKGLSTRDFRNATERRVAEMDITVPKHYCHDKMGSEILSSAIYGGTELRSQSVFLLTYAYEHPESPLHGALQENPDLFMQIDVVSRLRRDFGEVHFSRGGAPTNVVSELNTMRETVYGLLRALASNYFDKGSSTSGDKDCPF